MTPGPIQPWEISPEAVTLSSTPFPRAKNLYDFTASSRKTRTTPLDEASHLATTLPPLPHDPEYSRSLDIRSRASWGGHSLLSKGASPPEKLGAARARLPLPYRSLHGGRGQTPQ